MSKFTLDNIRKAAAAKYGSTDIEFEDGFVTRLMNPLRLSKDARKELANMQSRLDEEDTDQEQILADVVRLVAENSTAAQRLLDEVGEDLTVMVEIFRNYTEGTQAGEASASES